MSTPIKVPLALAVLVLCAVAVCAQAPGRDMAREAAIWKQLEAVAPDQVEAFKAATASMDSGDYQNAAFLYREVLKKAPNFDAALRRLGSSLVLAGNVDEGRPLLEQALRLNRSPENLASVAEGLAFPGGNQHPSSGEMERAFALTKEAFTANTENDSSYALLLAQLALEQDKEQDFRLAAKELATKYPDEMGTHYFNAIRAAMDGESVRAEDEIREAERLGLPSEVAQKFLSDTGVHTSATLWRSVYLGAYVVGAWAVGLLLLFVAGKVLSSMTMRSLDRADPNAPAARGEATLRSVYRALINVAGLYYYVSIPVVIALVVAVAGGAIYLFLLIGRIPIQLTAVLVIGAAVTIFHMVRTTFSRRQPAEPGRSLREGEAPELWALAHDVAREVGTRSVDEIRLTPFTDLAVYERGGLFERAQDRAKRVLVLGVGVLNGFKQTDFRAVLAHEYGHFLHRDTAGGDVAIRVMANMLNFAHSLARSGHASRLNVAFHFLRVYHFIFRRISFGATRLQEALADRVAVKMYGPWAFESGLKHVIAREVEFTYLANKELRNALASQRSVRNLYGPMDCAGTEDEREITKRVEEVLNRPTSEDETHPCPAERFRLARRIKCEGSLAREGDVWDLFANREALSNEMSAALEREVRTNIKAR